MKRENQRFSDFIGQDILKKKLTTLIEIAHQKGSSLDHLLLCGPTGFGKTFMVNAVANEMGVSLKMLNGTEFQRTDVVATILTSLRMGDILLIQNIENLRRAALDILIPAADEFSLDVVIGKKTSARNIRLRLPRFTLVGTSSNLARVDKYLKSHMLVYDFVQYSTSEMKEILIFLNKQYSSKFDIDAFELLSEHCDGNPGRASLLLGKINKYAQVYSANNITKSVVRNALTVFGQDNITV
jgi:holliday junction DNA helicase RuvB